ncbi:membrane-bound lytic murein transglycosylase MltF [Moritella viscosa]|uniref:membrane-bound lytic murein transglycosylase MltF n=1 Tax=Moritella viscosa TaxID=80854 RepID=UPI00091212B7|nr:membrane-bound lytic murein transglycosylase MltF [Moritella viscosa]SGY84705.1 Putative transglycosylase, Slt family [Moritella viscosa]
MYIYTFMQKGAYLQVFFTRLQLFLKSSLLIILSLVVSGCIQEKDERTQLEKIQDAGELHINTIYGPANYYLEGNKPAGLEYELLKKFSDYLGVKLVIHPHHSLKNMLENKNTKVKPIALSAGGLTRTEKRLAEYRMGPSYYQVKQLLIYRKGSLKPRSLQQINDPIYVVKSSSHEEYIQKLQRDYPELNLTYKTFPDEDILFSNLEEGTIKLAIADDTSLSQHQYYYPHLNKAFVLEDDLDVVWLMEKNIDDSLANAVLAFFTLQQASGAMEQLQEKYFGHIDTFDFVDTRTFLRRVDSQLPKYEELFRQYAGELDWRLLAAVSYQESHWNPKARSPTGVRGMMMLTWPTAREFGVTSRIDAEQSVRAGSAYLAKLIKRLPDTIPEHEKPWFALAAYNIGYSHLIDARKITQKLGGNENSWAEVKAIIPLLQQPKWYKYTRFGYARGNEAIKYVSNIRKYYDSLRWFDEQINMTEQVARDVGFELSTNTEQAWVTTEPE